MLSRFTTYLCALGAILILTIVAPGVVAAPIHGSANFRAQIFDINNGVETRLAIAQLSGKDGPVGTAPSFQARSRLQTRSPEVQMPDLLKDVGVSSDEISVKTNGVAMAAPGQPAKTGLLRKVKTFFKSLNPFKATVKAPSVHPVHESPPDRELIPETNSVKPISAPKAGSVAPTVKKPLPVSDITSGPVLGSTTNSVADAATDSAADVKTDRAASATTGSTVDAETDAATNAATEPTSDAADISESEGTPASAAQIKAFKSIFKPFDGELRDADDIVDDMVSRNPEHFGTILAPSGDHPSGSLDYSTAGETEVEQLTSEAQKKLDAGQMYQNGEWKPDSDPNPPLPRATKGNADVEEYFEGDAPTDSGADSSI